MDYGFVLFQTKYFYTKDLDNKAAQSELKEGAYHSPYFQGYDALVRNFHNHSYKLLLWNLISARDQYDNVMYLT